MNERMACAAAIQCEGPPPNVLRIAGENRERIQVLSKAINSLAVRLDRVMCGSGSVQARNATENAPRPAMSTLAEELDDHGREIVSAINAIDGILSRLEV